VLAVLVKIVRSAFEWSWPACIFFALGSIIGPAILLSIVFGEPPKTTP
jgi:hypothetical protein